MTNGTWKMENEKTLTSLLDYLPMCDPLQPREGHVIIAQRCIAGNKEGFDLSPVGTAETNFNRPCGTQYSFATRLPAMNHWAIVICLFGTKGARSRSCKAPQGRNLIARGSAPGMQSPSESKPLQGRQSYCALTGLGCLKGRYSRCAAPGY